MYYTFEFASKAPNYIRHALAVVTVGNGGPVCTSSVTQWKSKPGGPHCSTVCSVVQLGS